jgi:uncharacterized membrane protein SpoIIM required for sporulation
MVLEYLVGQEAKKPLELIATGFFYTSIAIFIAAILFFRSPSLVLVAFMTLPLVYVMTARLRAKSAAEVRIKSTQDLLRVNLDIVEMYTYVFLGMVLATAFWFAVLPGDLSSQLFSEQVYNLFSISQGVAPAPTGAGISEMTLAGAAGSSIYQLIAINNIKLVLLMTVMSFVFAAGALFILSWNASVVGVAIGMLIKRIQAQGADLATALAKGLPVGFAFYTLHLIPEIVAYFVAAIAGALISSAMMRYQPFSPKSNKLLMIAGVLVAIAIAVILFAAAVEVNLSGVIQGALRP